MSHFLSKIRGNHGGDEENLAASIQAHLVHLLNVRQGMTPHLKDYGLPDIQEVFYKLPGSLDTLADNIRQTVTTYEPRLSNVKVRLISDTKLESLEDFRATYQITADLIEGARVSRLQFDTEVERDGRANTRLVNRYG